MARKLSRRASSFFLQQALRIQNSDIPPVRQPITSRLAVTVTKDGDSPASQCPSVSAYYSLWCQEQNFDSAVS
ncbi:hypothetical protein NL676_029703 [Syzygium grande]|nr:hypothetical protein NL676_029703 [Syzygium grande]